MKKREIILTTEDSPTKRAIRRAMRAIHVVPRDSNAWEVRSMGPNRFSRVFPTRNEAISYARDVAPPHDDVSIHERRIPVPQFK